MKKLKLTPWFPPHIKPVRSGVYEIAQGLYSYWNGNTWFSACGSIVDAMSQYGPSDTQTKTWRGIKGEA